MPPPVDYRDLPYVFNTGFFQMDVEKLKARLTTAKLCLGPIEETLAGFSDREQPAPIGFIAFDLDYYSSTVAALTIFKLDLKYLLPRVVCYLDDMVGDVDFAYNEFTGELLAVKEFNAAHEDIKIAPVRGLRYSGYRMPQMWHEQMFVAHHFKHPDYGRPLSGLDTSRPLEG